MRLGVMPEDVPPEVIQSRLSSFRLTVMVFRFPFNTVKFQKLNDMIITIVLHW